MLSAKNLISYFPCEYTVSAGKRTMKGSSRLRRRARRSNTERADLLIRISFGSIQGVSCAAILR